jgi:ABC-2 type transport system permease protein
MSEFTGTLRLVRLALRRDRLQLPIWLLGLTAVLTGNAAGTMSLYDTLAERTAQATLEAGTVVSLVFNGPALGTGLGAVTFVESFSVVSLLIGMMSAFGVVRHTRQNEENGRAEMIGSLVVGRYASLTAALLVMTGTSVLLGVMIFVSLVAIGLPVAGSLAAAAGLTGIGVSFAAVAAVSAQVSAFARGANVLAGCTVAAAFVLRAVGDTYGTIRPGGTAVTSAWPSWISPLGWSQQVRPYAGNRWWVLVLPIVLAGALTVLAFVLVSHRDFGQGLVYPRPGPASASRRLLSPLGLAWRLQRGALLGWTVGLGLLGLGVGAVGNAVESLLSASDQVRRIFEEFGGGANLVDAYFATVMNLTALAVTAYAVQALLRMRAEETGALESVLATATSRTRWLLAHTFCVLVGIVLLLVTVGLGSALAYTLATGKGDAFGGIFLAAVVQIPACLSLGGLTVALVGLLPRFSIAAAWTALAVCLLIRQLGPPLRLPQTVLNISPYTHTPTVPSVPVTLTPLIVTSVVAIVFIVGGLLAFQRRSLTF